MAAPSAHCSRRLRSRPTGHGEKLVSRIRSTRALSGAAYLPTALATHLPLDLVAIMLGACDTVAYYGRGPFDIAVGMSNLLGIVAASAGGVCTAYPAPPVPVLAPPVLGDVTDPWFRERTGSSAKQSPKK